MHPNGRAVALVTLALIGCGLLAAAGVTGAMAEATTLDASTDGEPPVDSPPASIVLGTDDELTEEAYLEPVPEPGDSYFEAEATDGSWISYVNPRDEYRDPYLGGGSGKICVTLLNERGEPIVGESVPDTTVTVPTGESLEWHTAADPLVVEYPLTAAYERPLDADQFGTNPELPQGDGYLDSHCLELHGLPEDGTVEYGEAEIDGEAADRIEVVGYHQQAHEAWDSDVDPIDDATSYAEAGGGWTYRTDGSHGQAVVVLQLTGEEADDGTDGDGDDGTGDHTDDGTDGDADDETGDDADDGTDGDADDETGDDADDGTDGDADDETDDDADDGTDDDADDGADGDSDDGAADDVTGDDAEGSTGANGDGGATTDDSDDIEDDGAGDADRIPGFGLLLGGIAVAAVLMSLHVRRRET